MHLLLSAEESEPFLIEELRRSFPHRPVESIVPGLLSSDFVLQPEAPPTLVFARQLLPDAQEFSAPSIAAWSERLFAEVVPRLAEAKPWRLQVVPHFGVEQAGRNRCRLIREAFRELLQRKRRGWRRTWQDDAAPFTPEQSLVQLLLVSPERGFLSVAPAPMPFQFRRVISSFPKGDIPVAIDKAAPSRAFTKLVEAELRLGRCLAPGETCVDLGASPGSWSYVALQRGAKVVAVDRAPLRADLMRHRQITFRQGDAFTFRPGAPVDWLLCDVIAAPERSIELLLQWLREGWARRFVVTIKFKGHEDYARLEQLKDALAAQCGEYFLTRLCANKNEACAFGIAGTEQDSVQRKFAFGGVGT